METKLTSDFLFETDLWFSMLSSNPAFYLPSGVRISIGTFVWTNLGNRLPLCNVLPPLFGLNLLGPSERCKTWGPLASLLFLTSITSTFHIWTGTYWGLQLSLSGIVHLTLYHGPRPICIKWTGWCILELQYVRCILKLPSPTCLWPSGKGSSVHPATTYQSGLPGALVRSYVITPLLISSLAPPPFPTFWSPSPLQQQDCKYYAQTTQLTFKLPSRSRNLNPSCYIFCTVVMDIHRDQKFRVGLDKI